MIRIFVTVFAALLGLAFGSFLNVCLSRWPQGESVVKPRSHCRNCGRILPWWENVPLVSWAALRGRCRGCGSWIGWRYVAVEAAVGGLWAMVAWRAMSASIDLDAPSADLLMTALDAVFNMIFLWTLVALAVLDAEFLWLPDSITLPGIGVGVLWVNFQTDVFESRTHVGMGPLFALLSTVLDIAVAAGLILLIRWIYSLIRRREGMGLGDAKLMALLAAWLGLPGALLAFGLGVVLGASMAIIGLVAAKRDAEEAWGLEKLPLGTFLCVGGVISELWGREILSVYSKWAGF